MAPASSRQASTSKKTKTTKKASSTTTTKKAKTGTASKKPTKKRPKYSAELRAKCYKGAYGRKPLGQFKCPLCHQHTVRTVLAFAQYIAGHWYHHCTNNHVKQPDGSYGKCKYWDMPNQPGPPEKQIEEIEEQRELDQLFALNGLLPNTTTSGAGPSNAEAGPSNVLPLPATPESGLGTAGEPSSSSSTRTSTSSAQLERDLEYARRLQALINEDVSAQENDDVGDADDESSRVGTPTPESLSDEAHAALLADEVQEVLLADAQAQSQDAGRRAQTGTVAPTATTSNRLMNAAIMQAEGNFQLNRPFNSKVLKALDKLNEADAYFATPSSEPSPVVTPTPAPRAHQRAEFPMEQLTPLSPTVAPRRQPHLRAAMSTGRPSRAVRTWMRANAGNWHNLATDQNTMATTDPAVSSVDINAATSTPKSAAKTTRGGEDDRTIPQKRARSFSESSVISISSTDEPAETSIRVAPTVHVKREREDSAEPPAAVTGRAFTEESSLQSSNKENHDPQERLPGETHVCDRRCEVDFDDLFAEGVTDEYDDVPELLENHPNGDDEEPDDELPELVDIPPSDDECEHNDCHPTAILGHNSQGDVRERINAAMADFHRGPAALGHDHFGAAPSRRSPVFHTRHGRTRGLPIEYDLSCFQYRGVNPSVPIEHTQQERAPWDTDSNASQGDHPADGASGNAGDAPDASKTSLGSCQAPFDTSKTALVSSKISPAAASEHGAAVDAPNSQGHGSTRPPLSPIDDAVRPSGAPTAAVDQSPGDGEGERDDDMEEYIASLYAPYVVERAPKHNTTPSWTHDFDKVMAWMLKIFVWTMDCGKPKLHELPVMHTQDSILLTDAARLSTLLRNLRVREVQLWDPIITSWKTVALIESIFVCEHVRHSLLVRLPSVKNCGDFAKTLAIAKREGTAWTPGPSPAPVDNEPALRLRHSLDPNTPQPMHSRKGKEVDRG